MSEETEPDRAGLQGRRHGSLFDAAGRIYRALWRGSVRGEGMTYSDVDLMRENLKAIAKGDCLGLRVSQEHYAWLAGHRGTLLAIVEAAGGYVEGHPTSLVNVLQRVRDMREAL